MLGSKSTMYMAKNGKNTKQTRYTTRIMNFKGIEEKWKMHKFDSCEEGLQLADIDTENVN